MKIEKINDNKLKIILSKQDLIDKNIDIYTLSKQNLENQDLFLDILYEADLEYNFNLADSPLLIEGLANSNGSFILTITKLNKNKDKDFIQNSNFKKIPELKVKRKTSDFKDTNIIYSFTNFDDFTDFTHSINSLPLKYVNSLYLYKNKYYLIFENLTETIILPKKILNKLSDFADFVINANLFKCKLYECGEIVIEKNAIQKIKKI